MYTKEHMVMWVIPLCSILVVRRRFGIIYRLQLHGKTEECWEDDGLYSVGRNIGILVHFYKVIFLVFRTQKFLLSEHSGLHWPILCYVPVVRSM